MDISGLNEFFDIAHYRPDKAGRATVELVGGEIRLRIPYRFYSQRLAQVNPTMMIDAVVTEQQLSGIKTVMVAILQATNAEIEDVCGWERYEEGNDE